MTHDLWRDLESLASTAKHAPDQLDPERVRDLARQAQVALEDVGALRHPTALEYSSATRELRLEFDDVDEERLAELLRWLFELDG